MAKVLGISECKSRSMAMFFQVVVFCCRILLSDFITDVCSCLAQDKQLPARFLHGSGAMATFTTEQFGELVVSTMALSQALSANSQVAAAMTPGGGADRRDRGSRKLSMKAFNRVTKFAQGEAQWKEFHFDFGVLIGAEYPPLLETLKVVEQMPDETDTPMVRALDGEYADRLDLEKVSKELYEVLVTITEGEAKLMVKDVLNNDGVFAYHRLYRHYKRRTLASTSNDQGSITPEGCTRLEAAHFEGSGVGGQMGQDGGRTQGNTSCDPEDGGVDGALPPRCAGRGVPEC